MPLQALKRSGCWDFRTYLHHLAWWMGDLFHTARHRDVACSSPFPKDPDPNPKHDENRRTHTRCFTMRNNNRPAPSILRMLFCISSPSFPHRPRPRAKTPLRHSRSRPILHPFQSSVASKSQNNSCAAFYCALDVDY